MAGLKHDEKKLRVDLIPSEPIEALAAILTFGAKKYTTNKNINPEELLNLCDSQNVIQIESISPEGCVVTAMRSGYEPTLQGMLNANDKVIEGGIGPILIKQGKLNEKKAKIRNIKPGNEDGSLKQSMVWTKPLIKDYVNKAAASVELLNFFTVTMTLKQGNLEEYFVVSTTWELECWEILLKELKKRCYISNNVEIKDSKLFVTGDNNWMDGLKFRKVYAAKERHRLAFRRGEFIDQESGYPHLWHEFCNLAFLIYYNHPDNYARYEEFNDFKIEWAQKLQEAIPVEKLCRNCANITTDVWVEPCKSCRKRSLWEPQNEK